MSAAFIEQLQQGLALCGNPAGPVLVGVSGGADSVALLRGLHQLAGEASGFALFVLHVDHGLRDDSAEEAAWVCELAQQLSIPCETVGLDVRSISNQSGVGIEEAARNARYAAFVEEANRQGCRFVAVAHHRDDNVETVLHHVVRGTGLQGLAGIPRTRRLTDSLTLIRPLLDVGRAEIVSFLDEQGSGYVEDPSNFDVVFTRNRIRSELIPTLESEFNPQVRSAIHRLSNQARDANEMVTRYATSLLHRACEMVSASEVCVRCDMLREEPSAAIRAMMVRVWIEQGWPRKKMGFAEWESLSELVSGQSVGCGRDLPGGVNAARKKATLTLRLGSEA